MLYFLYFYIVFAFLGAAIGSFLNVVIDRIPAKQSLVFPPSHCPVCGQRLRAWDLVPVMSYLALKGRCRYCRAPIPRRILWVELGTAAGFAFLLLRYGLSLELAVACFYWVLLTGFLVIAFEQKPLSGRILYPAAAIILLIDIFGHDPGLLNGLIGVGVGMLVMAPLGLGRGRAGWDDVQMAGLTGLALGFPEGLVALLIGAVLAGLVFGSRWLISTKGGAKVKVNAFVPFLAVTMAIMLFWGQSITGWYLSLF
jgi:leader peptidase (prepilin peptidase) / N-methyltransferase